MQLTRTTLDMQVEYEALAQAIVLQAVEDYRSARRRLRRPDTRPSAQAAIRHLEHFFRTRWCGMLADIDGEKLIQNLKEEPVDDHERIHETGTQAE